MCLRDLWVGKSLFPLASSTCSFRAAGPWPWPTHPSVGQIRSIAGGRHHAQRASQQRSGIGDCAPPIRCSIAMYFCTLAGRPGPIILVQAPSLSLSNYSISAIASRPGTCICLAAGTSIGSSRPVDRLQSIRGNR